MKTIMKFGFLKHLVLVLFVLSFCSVFADNVVGYDLTASAASTIGQTGTFSVSAGLTAPSFSGDGAVSSGWNGGGKYWTISPFNTTGLHTITVGAMMNTDDAGPRDFQLQYKLSGGVWTNVGAAITLTGTLTAYNRTLPDECANVTGLEVRWLNTSTMSSVGGTVTSDASTYIKAISILGSLPTRPNTQFTGITFTAITSTTIKIDGTIGNGSHRIIYIVKNTTGDVAPNFPVPADDAVFTANPNYSTGNPTGYQVIYNGTGSSVTVTVPSSTNEYWFRVYEYNQNGTMPRYFTPTATKNPYLCALPTIVADPATLIRLTTATIGATITSSKTTVTARGTQIKTGSSLGESTTNKVGAGSGTGSFTRDLTGQTRGSRFYFRAYATNECGTIYSDELYYENIPIFSGTGTWEDNTKWNVLQVPGSMGTGWFGSSDDSPIIKGNCTLEVTNTVTDLKVETGKLTINKATTLYVTGTLTNLVGNAGILIKSRTVSDVDASGLDEHFANGSLIFANGSPSGTVEMYSKANWNLTNAVNNKYKWQFFTIPVKTMTAGSTFNFSSCYVREWDESVKIDLGGIWQKRNDGSTLYVSGSTSMNNTKGYEVVQENPKVYTFAGALQNTDFVKTLSYHSDAAYPGQNIMGNPFTAAVDINLIQFGDAEKAIYQYNTGTYTDWSTIGGATQGAYSSAITPGRYTVSTPNTAGTLGTLREIPSMQGFLVKTTVNGGAFTIPKSALMANMKPQRAMSNVALSRVATRIDVVGTKFSDCMWMFSDASCTRGFDNGWDAKKMPDFPEVAQIYSMEADGNYQINAVSNINESYIGFQPGEDTEYKLIFNHQNLQQNYSKLYLIDLVANFSIDISNNGSEYSFTSSPTDDVKRFKIVTTPTGSTQNALASKVSIYNNKNTILINNTTNESGQVAIYNTIGHCLQVSTLEANKQNVLNTNLSLGAYIVKTTIGSEKVTQRIIVN